MCVQTQEEQKTVEAVPICRVRGGDGAGALRHRPVVRSATLKTRDICFRFTLRKFESAYGVTREVTHLPGVHRSCLSDECLLILHTSYLPFFMGKGLQTTLRVQLHSHSAQPRPLRENGSGSQDTVDFPILIFMVLETEHRAPHVPHKHSYIPSPKPILLKKIKLLARCGGWCTHSDSPSVIVSISLSHSV